MGIWTRKSIAELKAHSLQSRHNLKRVLDAKDLILLGIGAVVGAGLFSISGIAAAEHAGPAIVIAFLIAAIGCALAGFCYCELASMIPLAGSAYTYAYASMGELIAWMMGWTLILEYAIGAAAVSISWSAYVVSFCEDLNMELPLQWIASPWQPVQLSDGSLAYGWINLPALFIIVVVSLVLIKGIKESNIINALIVTAKLLATIVFIVVGFFYIDARNYHPFIPPNTGEFGQFGWSGILRASGILFFAYIGFDAVSTAAQETKNAKRNIPIGILGSLLISTLIYVLFGFVLTGLVNYQKLSVAAPVALAVAQTPFLWINWLIKMAVLAGLTSVIIVMLLGQSRIFYSMARDGLLPPLFAVIHPQFQTPWCATFILMIFVGLIGAFAPIEAVGNMTSIGTLAAFGMVCLGVLILRYIAPELPRPFRTPCFPVIPLSGIAVCLIMAFSLELMAWLRLIGWLSLGLLVYFAYGYKRANRNL